MLGGLDLSAMLARLRSLAGAAGALLIGFIQAGVGAVAETVQAALRRSVYLDQYGGDNTGVSTNTAALTAAVTALGSGGGDILLNAGSYLFNTTGTIAQSGIRLIGKAGATTILNGQTNAAAITFGDGVTLYNRCGVRDLLFASKSGVVGVAGQIGLRVRKQGKFVLKNVEAVATPAALYDGIVLDTVSQSRVSRAEAEGCLNDGIQLRSITDLYVFGMRSDANGRFGFYQLDSQGMWLTSCTGYNNTTNAWRIDDGGGQLNKNNVYVNCVGDTSGDNNWQVTQLNNSMFFGCWGGTQKATGVNPTAAGFLFGSSACKALTMTGCIAVANNGNGFYLFNNGTTPTDVTFTNCIAGTSQVAGCGNGAGGAGSGYSIDAGAARVHINDGQATGNATAAITNNASTDIVFRGVVGYVTKNKGTGTIASGTTAVTVNHGLSATPEPSGLTVTFTNNPTNDPGNIWVSAISSTQFTVNCRNNPGAGGATFEWMAERELI